MSINPVHFSKEIAYNLDIMESTVSKGTAVDLGFLAIFQNDIHSLASQKMDHQVSAVLSHRLQGVADKLKMIKPGAFSNAEIDPTELVDVDVPYIGGLTEFSELIKTYSSGPTKIGLEYLEPQFNYRPIKGDGHCLFRSIAAGLLFEMQKKGIHEKEMLLGKLMDAIEPLGNKPQLEKGLALLIKCIDDVIANRRTVQEIIGSQKESDALVQFMRHLAIEQNKAQGSDVIKQEADSSSGSLEAYHANMVDMSKKECGGDVEILALANALGIKIQVLHPEAFGKGNLSLDHLALGPESSTKLWLLYRPGHYDLAFQKEA